MKSFKLWDENLSKKLQVLNYLEPILKIKAFRPRSDKLRDLIDYYDPLAITLLIIQTIIGSIRLEKGIQMEISERKLIKTILPFFEVIDHVKNYSVTREQHLAYLKEIITRLESKQSSYHQVKFIDYLDPQLRFRERNFGILYTKTQSDGTILYTIDHSMITLFSMIGSEFELEDQVVANRLLLEYQIKKKDVDNSLNMIKKLINDTKAYFAEIETIIAEIKQDYQSKIWREVHRTKLEKSKNHLMEWLGWQRDINLTIQTHFFGLEDEYYKLERLKMSIEESHSMFVKLHLIVSQAIQTFYQEHFPQAFFIPKSSYLFSPQEQIFPAASKLPLKEEQQLLNILLSYFVHVKINPIHSLENTLNYLLSGIETSTHKKIEIQSFNYDIIEKYHKFPQDVITAAHHNFNQFLLQNSRTSLATYIQWAKTQAIEYTVVIYVCLMLQRSYDLLDMTGIPKIYMKTENKHFTIDYFGRSIEGDNLILEVVE